MKVLRILPWFNSTGVFWSASWSPDGRMLVGYVNLETGVFAEGLQVLSVDDWTYRTVATGLINPAGWPSLAHWLSDSQRVLHSGPAGISLVDVTRDATRLILAAPPGARFTSARTAPDDRDILYLRAEEEADIWVARAETVKR